ncbi:hypothetical protein ACGFI9_01985 [Micromonospora sp. NPDC048930]|uniref:hypothetical protein n=1 Tax=Micromonospora sp. NPDC048930 TaxID=3364261 RepID=UPI0037172E5E
MHGLSAIDVDRRIRPARTDAPLTAHPAAPQPGRAAALRHRHAAAEAARAGNVGPHHLAVVGHTRALPR